MLSTLLSLALAAAPSQGTGEPPNDVLVILLDDVGRDLLGLYGGPQPARTPTLDLLASRGRLYERAYASPLCAPSRACMVTGRYAFRTGFGTNNGVVDSYELYPYEECVPELLTSTDTLSVQVFNKWHLINSFATPATDRHPILACAFDGFFGHVSNIGAEPTEPFTDHYRWRRVDASADSTDVTIFDGYLTDDFSEAVWATSICKEEVVGRLNALDPSKQAVFFWCPFAPHAPFQLPPTTLISPETARGLRPAPYVALPGEERPYALAMLEAIDTLIGEALEEIEPLRRQRLTVIVMGDNGTSQKVIHPSLDPTKAKGSVFEGGVGVPLIVTGPLVRSPGTRDDSLVHIVDLPATIADLIGSTAPVGEDSVSFYDTFVHDSPGARTSVFAERFEPNGYQETGAVRAMIGPRYKLIRETDAHNVVDRLYDLDNDPNEDVDLLSGPSSLYHDLREYTDLVEALEALLAPTPSSFCDETDDALASCPCGNEGFPLTGCDLPQGTGGVILEVAEQRTVPLNRATLTGTGYPLGAFPAVVLRATELDEDRPVVFGDGLRCVGVPLVRLSATWSAQRVSTHVLLHGPSSPQGANHYQLWYRSVPGSFCDPAAAFNASNGRTLWW